MNKEQLKNVISRFYNVDATKTGTEIGLNFTKELVELHSGEIYVESQLFKGSKFIVKLHLDIKLESDIVKNIKKRIFIKEVTHKPGSNSTTYFSKTFKELFNMTPIKFIE